MISLSDLVISYFFPPRSETAGLVMAKRMISENIICDVIQGPGGDDADIDSIVSDNIERRTVLDIKGEVDSVDFIREFVKRGMESIEKDYDTVYSRAQILSNHFLALEYKLAHQESKWIAEFSDPLLLYIYTGKVKDFTRAKLTDTAYISKINGAIESYNNANSTSFELLDNPANTFRMAEYLTFIFADKIIFTNENQRSVMLDQYSDEIKKLVLDKSQIKPHPTLEYKYYQIKDYDINLDKDSINIAYFGSYFVIRHFESLFNAYEALNHKYKDKIKLYFFTPETELLKILTDGLEISQNIIFKKPINYLEFLNACTKFDILLINDSITKGNFKINPYLPSKLSDYLGCEGDIWAICEKESPTSKIDLKYMSYMDDYGSSADVLVNILKDYNYDDGNYTLKDNVYERRINSLNWAIGELASKNRNYESQITRLKNENQKLKEKSDELKKPKDGQVTTSLRKAISKFR